MTQVAAHGKETSDNKQLYCPVKLFASILANMQTKSPSEIVCVKNWNYSYGMPRQNEQTTLCPRRTPFTASQGLDPESGLARMSYKNNKAG